MFVQFSPLSFIFLCVYLLILSFLPSLSTFIIFWLFMELLMLVFMGLRYALFLNRVSSLMLYFLVQTLASFGILFAIISDLTTILYLSLFLKLSLFPFYSWFPQLLYRFPNFLVWLCSTLHKLPPLFLYISFFPKPFIYLWVVISISLLVSGFTMLSLSDFRLAIVFSSVGNNSWFLLSASVDFLSFLFYFSLYSIFLLSLLAFISSSSSPSSNLLPLLRMLVFISGLPPSPLFLAKFYIVFQSLESFTFLLLPFLLSASVPVCGYLWMCSKYLTFKKANFVL